MGFETQDVIRALDEARESREGLEALRRAYASANASRAGRAFTIWSTLKATLRGGSRAGLLLSLARRSAGSLPDGVDESAATSEWSREAREATQRLIEQLQAEIAVLSRHLAESRTVAAALGPERDVERAAARSLRTALVRVRADLMRVARAADEHRALADELRSERDAERARVASLSGTVERLTAAVDRERRSARHALGVSLHLADNGVRSAAQGESSFAHPAIEKKRARLAAALKRSAHVLGTDRPVVSVIIPAYNQVAMTLDCLQSVVDTLDDSLALQLIVIDDASPRESVAAATSGLPFVTVLANGINLGFLRSCNRASLLATGKYLHFLNNDTLVRDGWLRELVACAESDERIGAVGSKLLFADGTLQEAGGIIWRDGSGWNYGRSDDPADPKYNYVRDVDYVSGASLLVRGDVFRELGLFSDEFAPAYFEDSDLCFALRARGMRVVYQPKSEVVHLEGISSGTSIASGVKKYQALNKPKFVAKWHDALQEHYVPDSVPGIRAARRLQARKTLVMIDNYVPEYDRDSGSNKLFNFIQLFGKLGYSVVYIPDNFNRSEPYTTTFQNLGVEIVHETDTLHDVEAAVRERLAIADVVWMGRPEIGERYVPIVREFPKLPILYDTHDLHYVRVRRELELLGETNPKKWAEWERARDQELRVIRAVDVPMTVTDVERDVLAGAGVENVFVMPNVHDSFPRVAPYESTSDVIFIGGYVHGPNVDAAVWLCEEIMPIVWETHPHIDVTLIGSNVPEAVRALDSERVHVVGFVHDVAPIFERARLMVAPLRYGAGLKGKIGHAFAYGLPVVTTPIGAEGFDLVDGRDALIAEDAAGFARAIVRAYEDRALWSTLSASAERIVKRYSPKATSERLAAALELGFRSRAAAAARAR